MPSLKDLMEFMGTSWPIALGLLLASVGLLCADYFAFPYVASLPTWAPGAAFITALLSGSVLIVSVIKMIIDLVSAPFAKRRRLAWQAQHAAGINDLSDPEKLILVWALANSTQVFAGPYFDGNIKALIARGYLSIPPGSHRTDETPLQIPNHIWSALKADLGDEDLSPLIGQRPFRRW